MNIYTELLKRSDPSELARHSVINHHVDGMHYLCLHRSATLTYKIYFIERPTNPNAGFLVHPHSHRYAFNTTVLHGGIQHIRFTEANGDRWDAFHYDSDLRALFKARPHKCLLDMSVEAFDTGAEYFVDSHEIHTLQTPLNSGPIVLGLTQFEDVKRLTKVFLSPEADGKLKYPNSRQPSRAEFEALRDRVLELIV